MCPVVLWLLKQSYGNGTRLKYFVDCLWNMMENVTVNLSLAALNLKTEFCVLKKH